MKDTLRRAWPPLLRWFQKAQRIIWRMIVKYNETDGEQRAASFAYYAFFSLFPLLLLLIAITTMFLGSEAKAMKAIIDFAEAAIPVDEGQTNWLSKMIAGVVASRGSAGIIAFVALFWSALRFFQALVHGVNKAWGMKEYAWYHMPIQNLFMVAIVASAFFLGVFMPPAINLAEYYYWQEASKVGLDFESLKHVFWFTRQIVPTLVLFYGLSMFYKFAPRLRRPYRDVWFSALAVTLALEGLQRLFLLYTHRISDFNRLYGTLGSVVAVLMWIYLSGTVIILGGCLAASIFEVNMHISDQSESETSRLR